VSHNPLGSIFDKPEDDDGGMSPMPNDPLHGPISSGFNWEQAQVPSGAVAKTDDALDAPRGQFAPALPPSEEFFCCQVGPCEHYGEWLAELDSAGARVMTEAHRVCTGFGQEAWAMDEGTRFACTGYSPPWWSPSGWRRRVISAHRINRMRRGLAKRTKLTLWERAVDAVYGVVKGDAPELPRPWAEK